MNISQHSQHQQHHKPSRPKSKYPPDEYPPPTDSGNSTMNSTVSVSYYWSTLWIFDFSAYASAAIISARSARVSPSYSITWFPSSISRYVETNKWITTRSTARRSSRRWTTATSSAFASRWRTASTNGRSGAIRGTTTSWSDAKYDPTATRSK